VHENLQTNTLSSNLTKMVGNVSSHVPETSKLSLSSMATRPLILELMYAMYSRLKTVSGLVIVWKAHIKIPL